MPKPNSLFTISKKAFVPVELVDYEDNDYEDYYDLADQTDITDEDGDNKSKDEEEDEYNASDIMEMKRGDSEFWATRGKRESNFWATRSGFDNIYI